MEEHQDSGYSGEGQWPVGVRSSPKRRKIPRVDRISDLPEEVIHRILSFLPAEDTVKTCVLSKQWRCFWTHAPKLTFRYNPYRPRFHLPRFSTFVDKTILFYKSGKMEKFELDFDCIFAEIRRNRLDSCIENWLQFATIRLVEELSLKFCSSDYCYYSDQYPIPEFVFNSSSLTKLSTSECSYAPKGQVCWSSLRALTIEHTELSSDVLQKILTGSPTLKYLKLHTCWVINSINISSSSVLEYLEVRRCWSITRIDASRNGRLEKLVLKEMQNHEDRKHNDVIEILCPNLKSVEISGYWLQKICRLLNVSSLTDVCLTLERKVSQFDCLDITKQLLEKIKHVKKITLGSYCVKVLSLLKSRGLPSPLSGSSCECLTLKTKLDKCYPFVLAHLLPCFPTLQKLVIDMTTISEVKEPPDERFLGNRLVFAGNYQVFSANYLEREDRTFIPQLEHLKTIEITGFRPHQYKPHDLRVVSFLLGNARVLKQMVIHVGCKVSEFDLDEKAKLSDLTQKLRSFPRCSPHAVVLID